MCSIATFSEFNFSNEDNLFFERVSLHWAKCSIPPMLIGLGVFAFPPGWGR